jgi:hypothetical protein
MISVFPIVLAMALLLTQQTFVVAQNRGGLCSGGTGLPQSFSKCGYEALSAYKQVNPASSDVWAEKALETFLSRKKLDCAADSKVNDVLIVCENEYQSRAYAMVMEVSIPCYSGKNPTLLQARVYDPDNAASATDSDEKFECINDICSDNNEDCEDD